MEDTVERLASTYSASASLRKREAMVVVRAGVRMVRVEGRSNGSVSGSVSDVLGMRLVVLMLMVKRVLMLGERPVQQRVLEL